MTKDLSVYKLKPDFQFETLVIERPKNFNGNWLDLLQLQSKKLKQLINETDEELKRRGIITSNETNNKQQHISSNNVGNLCKSQEFHSDKFQETLMKQNTSSIYMEDNQDQVQSRSNHSKVQIKNRDLVLQQIKNRLFSKYQTAMNSENKESLRYGNQSTMASSQIQQNDQLSLNHQFTIQSQSILSQTQQSRNTKMVDKIRTMQTELSPDLQVSFKNQNLYRPPRNKLAEKIELFRNKLPQITPMHQRSLQVTPLSNNFKSPMLRNSSRINSRYSHTKAETDQQNTVSRSGDLQNSRDQEIIDVPNLGNSPLNKKYTDFLAKDEKEKYEKLQENKKNMKLAMKNIDFIAAVTKSFKSRISIGMAATQGVLI